MLRAHQQNSVGGFNWMLGEPVMKKAIGAVVVSRQQLIDWRNALRNGGIVDAERVSYEIEAVLKRPAASLVCERGKGNGSGNGEVA
jgi:hypothetical protein